MNKYGILLPSRSATRGDRRRVARRALDWLAAKVYARGHRDKGAHVPRGLEDAAMTSKQFLNALANGETDVLATLLEILAETASPYCVSSFPQA